MQYNTICIRVKEMIQWRYQFVKLKARISTVIVQFLSALTKRSASQQFLNLYKYYQVDTRIIDVAEIDE